MTASTPFTRIARRRFACFRTGSQCLVQLTGCFGVCPHEVRVPLAPLGRLGTVPPRGFRKPSGHMLLFSRSTSASRASILGHARFAATDGIDRCRGSGGRGWCALHERNPGSRRTAAGCSGAAYWTGIGRIVYGMSEHRLLEFTGDNPENPTFALPCREVLAHRQRAITVNRPIARR